MMTEQMAQIQANGNQMSQKLQKANTKLASMEKEEEKTTPVKRKLRTFAAGASFISQGSNESNNSASKAVKKSPMLEKLETKLASEVKS